MLFLLFSVAFANSANAQGDGGTVTAANVYGVTTSNQLIRFNSATPAMVTTVGTITGLQGGENILGIDFRPATGELFALGSSSRLYVIDKSTGAAGSPRLLTTALSGTSFGFDFNPTVDRIRIVSNTGQNLRTDAHGNVTVDGMLNGAATGADASAYTNSFSGATSTTLYSISSTTDTLYTQNPPNAGTLVLAGPLGVNVTEVNGFDILSTDSSALAAFTVGTATSLYRINLTNGSATANGPIGSGATSLRGLAIETAVTTNFVVFGLTTANNLIRFNSSRPGVILNSVPITGLQGGENVLGIDFRPLTGQLFALGSSSRIYTIDTFTGVATLVGTLTTMLSGTNFGFDFNPTVDRIRIVSDTDQNLRANPADGTNLVDGTLAYAAGDANAGQNPNVTGSGYTNNFGGATATTLFSIDTNRDILVTQNPANAGTLNTIGSLGLNASGETGFDIASGNNTAFAAFQTSASGSALYTVNLTTGIATPIAPIGGGAVIRGLAVGRSTASGAATATLDFNGDGITDYVVFRPSTNTWFIRLPSGGFRTVVWGEAGDILTPGDYDGDGRTDVAVWRPSNGTFYIVRSSGGITIRQFGQNGDEPVARDYDGDGRTDYAVVRRAGGVMTWFVQNSSNGFFRAEQFGVETDIVAPGDYDGDGRFDLAVRRGIGNDPATFFLKQSTEGFATIQFGLGSDFVVPGDYDGDGRTDLNALREGTVFTWFYLSRTSFNTVQIGGKPDFSAQGDYDGDGRTDATVWDPIDAVFRSIRSANGALTEVFFGQNGDYPVANYDTH